MKPKVGLFLVPFCLCSAEPREWTSADGKKISAELVSYKDGAATIRRSGDSRVFVVPDKTLSEADVKFLAAWKGNPLRPLTISVKVEMGQMDAKATTWKTDYGSYAKEAAFARGLHILAKTTDSSSNPEVVLKYAFVGVDQASNTPVVYDSGAVPFRVESGFGYGGEIYSEVMSNSDENYAALGERYKDGVKPSGWAVIMEQDGKEVHASASTDGVMKMIRLLIEQKRVEFPTKEEKVNPVK
jgi:hypothetical protein